MRPDRFSSVSGAVASLSTRKICFFTSISTRRRTSTRPSSLIEAEHSYRSTSVQREEQRAATDTRFHIRSNSFEKTHQELTGSEQSSGTSFCFHHSCLSKTDWQAQQNSLVEEEEDGILAPLSPVWQIGRKAPHLIISSTIHSANLKKREASRMEQDHWLSSERKTERRDHQRKWSTGQNAGKEMRPLFTNELLSLICTLEKTSYRLKKCALFSVKLASCNSYFYKKKSSSLSSGSRSSDESICLPTKIFMWVKRHWTKAVFLQALAKVFQ